MRSKASLSLIFCSTVRRTLNTVVHDLIIIKYVYKWCFNLLEHTICSTWKHVCSLLLGDLFIEDIERLALIHFCSSSAVRVPITDLSGTRRLNYYLVWSLVVKHVLRPSGSTSACVPMFFTAFAPMNLVACMSRNLVVSVPILVACYLSSSTSWKTQTWPRICKLAQNWATLKKYFFYCLFYCLFYCTNIVEIHVGHRIPPCRFCLKTWFSVLLLYKYMLDTISTAICTIVLTIHVEHHIIACLEPQILARHAYSRII